MDARYRKISIPASLIENVECLIKNNLLSYRTPSEFVIDTVRRRVDDPFLTGQIVRQNHRSNQKNDR